MYTYYSGEEHLLRMILMVYFFIIIAGLAAGIVRYILKSIGMYRIARNRNMDNAWLAWVPYARTYLQGELSGAVSFGRQKIKTPGLWMILIPLVSGFFIIILEVIIIFSVVTDGMYYVSGVTSLFNGFFVFLVILTGLLAIAAGIAVKVLKVFVNRQVFEALTSDSMALFHAVASVLVPLYEDICFFVLRDKGRPAEYDCTEKYRCNSYQGNTGYIYQGVQTGTPQNTEVPAVPCAVAVPETSPEHPAETEPVENAEAAENAKISEDTKTVKTPETETADEVPDAKLQTVQQSAESTVTEEQKPEE